jgi:hypothetical protein
MLENNNTVETSYGHKKEKNGESEVPVRKFSKVSCEKQTDKGEQALNEMTRKATSNYEQ